MSIVKQINDRGAVMAWSPLRHMPPMIATATKEGGGGGFDEYGGELSVHSVDLANPSLDCPVISSVKTSSRFASLAWGYMTNKADKYPAGLLVGGMSDGIVNVWDAHALVTGHVEGALISKLERHRASVKALQFNPHAGAQHLLAAGSVDGDVSIMNLDNPTSASIASPLGSGGQRLDSEITSVAWNTSVAHILATATLGGTVVVWDLKENKAWCQLRDPHRASVSDVVWNPHDGLYLVTACDDDSRPVLRVWDLRSSTNAPLCELIGHTKGILSIDWCPHDPNLLVSCGKDSHTFIWDIQQGRAIAELPSPTSSSKTNTGTGPLALGAPLGGSADPMAHANALFGSSNPATSVFGGVPPTGFDAASNVFGGATLGGLGAGAGRRYCARWSKVSPSLLATCSFDRKVVVHAVTAIGPAQAATSAAPIMGQSPPVEAAMRRAPRWLRRPVGAAFGFGGRLVNFACPVAAAKNDLRAAGTEYPKLLNISVVNTDYDFVSKATTFESNMSNIESTAMDARAFCDAKVEEYSANNDAAAAQQWVYIRSLYAENPRAELLSVVGFDAAATRAALDRYLGVQQPVESSPAPSPSAETAPLHSAGGLSFDGFDASHNPITSAVDLFSAPRDVPSPSAAADEQPGQSVSTMNGDHQPQDKAAPTETVTHTAADATAEHSYENRRVPNAADDAVLKQALLIGDFAAAVAVCLKQDRLDDALIIASSADPALWASTQAEYFKRKAGSLMGGLGSVVRGDLHAVVNAYELGDWREALAVLCTYGSNENFYGLCEELGDRLALTSNDHLAATLVYIAANAVDKVVSLWTQEAGNRAVHLGRPASLQEVVEKVQLFKRAVWIRLGNPPVASAIESSTLATHATFVANEGYLASASFFAARISDAPLGTTPEPAAGHVIRDRLLRCFTHGDYAAPAAQAIFSSPFPYTVRQVDVAPAAPTTHDSHAHAHAHAYDGYGMHGGAPAHAHASASMGPGSTFAPVPAAQTHHYHPAPAMNPAIPSSYSTVPAHASHGWNPPMHAPAAPAAMPPTVAHAPMGMGHAPSHVPAPAPAPVPAPAPQPIAIPADFEASVANIANVNAWLQSLPLTANEKKQSEEGDRAVDNLRKKANAGRVSREAYAKLSVLGAACAAWDMNAASRTVSELSRIDFAESKDWLTGIRYITSLATMKMATAR